MKKGEPVVEGGKKLSNSELRERRDALWRLKQGHRAKKFSDIAKPGEDNIPSLDFSEFPDIESYDDLGSFEIVLDRWVFRRRPPYTVSDYMLVGDFSHGRLFSLLTSPERLEVEQKVKELNRSLDKCFEYLETVISLLEERMGIYYWWDVADAEHEKWIDPFEVHRSTIVGINELFSRPREAPMVLIEQLLAKGWIGLLAGASKSYKSWLALQLALAISKGGSWLGFQCRKSRVLYVDYELSHSSLTNRMVKLCRQEAQGEAVLEDDDQEFDSDNDWDPNEFIRKYGPLHGPDFLVMGQDFHRKNQVAAILDSIRRMKDPASAFIEGERTANVKKEGRRDEVNVPDDEVGLYSGMYDLIIIDPLYMLLNGRDENSATEMVAVFEEIRKLQKYTGAAILINTHFRKGPRDWRTSSTDRISGSGVFARYPDLILTLNRVSEATSKAKQSDVENQFILDVTLRHLRGVDPIALTRKGCIFTVSRKGDTDVRLVTEVGTRGPKRKVGSKIRAYLRSHYKELNGKPLAEIVKSMEEAKPDVFKRSSLYKFFQHKSDDLTISGRKRIVTLPFAERNRRKGR